MSCPYCADEIKNLPHLSLSPRKFYDSYRLTVGTVMYISSTYSSAAFTGLVNQVRGIWVYSFNHPRDVSYLYWDWEGLSG